MLTSSFPLLQSDSDNEILLSVIDAAPLPQDLLDRKPIFDHLFKIISLLSAQQSSCAFALTGQWGSGKTFILDLLKDKLTTFQDGNAFAVFPYNCWQYDYYEEPLTAIVSAMIDHLDRQEHLLSPELRRTLAERAQVFKPILQKLFLSVIRNKLGVDLQGLAAFLPSESSLEDAVDAAQQLLTSPQSFDPYLSLNSAIQEARTGLERLAAKQTVVVLVDELDRCTPTYAIKVLERLHHLFDGVKNVIVLFSVDKNQLSHTIQQIFGSQTNIDAYLKKFISFEVPLPVSPIKGSFLEKYPEYESLFVRDGLKTTFDYDAFFSALFAETPIRDQERLMERVRTIHTLLFPDVAYDFSFLCCEVLLAVFSQHDVFRHTMPIQKEKQGFSLVSPSILPKFSEYLKTEWRRLDRAFDPFYSDEVPRYLLSRADIPELLLWFLYRLYPHGNLHFRLQLSPEEILKYENYLEDLKLFHQLLDLLR